MNNLNQIATKYPDGAEHLISILQEIQETYGYLPSETFTLLGEKLSIPASKIYGVATFYNQFRFVPKGQYHIRLCYGTACHLAGSSTFLKEIEKILKIRDGQVTKDGLFSLEVKSCIGGCGQAPVIAINDRFYPRITIELLKETIETIQRNNNAYFD